MLVESCTGFPGHKAEEKQSLNEARASLQGVSQYRNPHPRSPLALPRTFQLLLPGLRLLCPKVGLGKDEPSTLLAGASPSYVGRQSKPGASSGLMSRGSWSQLQPPLGLGPAPSWLPLHQPRMALTTLMAPWGPPPGLQLFLLPTHLHWYRQRAIHSRGAGRRIGDGDSGCQQPGTEQHVAAS